MKTLGWRFETGPSEVFERFGIRCTSTAADRLRQPRSQAFRAALERVGILSVAERTQIVKLRRHPRRGASPQF